MLILLLALLIILIVAGAGFALHVLWWVAIAALIVWLLAAFARRFLSPRAGQRDEHGQGGGRHGHGPGQADRAAGVVRLRGRPSPSPGRVSVTPS